MAEAARILVAMFDRDEREALCDLLELEGYEVLAAHNSQVALATLNEQLEPPELLVCDVELRAAGGTELMRRVCELPCVLTSNLEGIDQEAVHLGANAGLMKPLRTDVMLSLVARLTKRTVSGSFRRLEPSFGASAS